MLKEIFTISNYPKLYSGQKWEERVLAVFKVYGWVIVTMIALGPLWLLADKLVTDVFHHKSFNAHYRQAFQHIYKKLGTATAIVFICIAGPVFEELIFRLPLSFNKRHVAIAVGIAVFYAGGGMFYHPHIPFLKIVVQALFALVITGLAFKYIPNERFSLSHRRQRFFIILSICLFGFIHISNYQPLDWPLLWLYPVFIIPQLLIGWGITYVRFKHGFVWGIALHVLVNSVSTLLSLLVK